MAIYQGILNGCFDFYGSYLVNRTLFQAALMTDMKQLMTQFFMRLNFWKTVEEDSLSNLVISSLSKGIGWPNLSMIKKKTW